jgi:hypothetical protein
VKDLKAKIKCYRNKIKALQRLMSERETDEMLMKQVTKLKNENGHLRDTVTLLRNEMEQLNEQKNFETSSSFLKDFPVKDVSKSEACHLKARMDLLLERLADFNTNIYNFQEERQELQVIQNRVKEMVAHLDGNISDLSGTLRSSLPKSTFLGCNCVFQERQYILEQKLQDMSEELDVVLQERDALISLSNRLRVNLQRKSDCQCQLRCISPEVSHRVDSRSMDYLVHDGVLLDSSELKLCCQQATLNHNDKSQQRTTSMPGKSSERVTQSQKDSLERIQRQKYNIENMKAHSVRNLGVRNWNVQCDGSMA